MAKPAQEDAAPLAGSPLDLSCYPLDLDCRNSFTHSVFQLLLGKMASSLLEAFLWALERLSLW